MHLPTEELGLVDRTWFEAGRDERVNFIMLQKQG